MGRGKRKFVWTDEKEDALIDKFEKTEGLYNTEAAGYSVGPARLKIYAKFGEELDIPGKIPLLSLIRRTVFTFLIVL